MRLRRCPSSNNTILYSTPYTTYSFCTAPDRTTTRLSFSVIPKVFWLLSSFRIARYLLGIAAFTRFFCIKTRLGVASSPFQAIPANTPPDVPHFPVIAKGSSFRRAFLTSRSFRGVSRLSHGLRFVRSLFSLCERATLTGLHPLAFLSDRPHCGEVNSLLHHGGQYHWEYSGPCPVLTPLAPRTSPVRYPFDSPSRQSVCIRTTELSMLREIGC